MTDLATTSIREQIGASEPAILTPGLVVRVLDPPGQYYVTADSALAPNTQAGTDPYALWLAPRRLLVVCETQGPPPVDGFVSDVTDGLVLFEITGTRAPDILAMSITLGPDHATLAHGRCAQTLFGGVKVLLYAHGDGFRLHAERQFAAFLLEWLTQAAAAVN